MLDTVNQSAEQRIEELETRLDETINLVLRIAECIRIHTSVDFFDTYNTNDCAYFGPGGNTGGRVTLQI